MPRHGPRDLYQRDPRSALSDARTAPPGGGIAGVLEMGAKTACQPPQAEQGPPPAAVGQVRTRPRSPICARSRPPTTLLAERKSGRPTATFLAQGLGRHPAAALLAQGAGGDEPALFPG